MSPLAITELENGTSSRRISRDATLLRWPRGQREFGSFEPERPLREQL